MRTDKELVPRNSQNSGANTGSVTFTFLAAGDVDDFPVRPAPPPPALSRSTARFPQEARAGTPPEPQEKVMLRPTSVLRARRPPNETSISAVAGL